MNARTISDPFTMELRLCDDAGMVSHERVESGAPGTTVDPDLTYLKLLNNLRARNGNPDSREAVTEPFACTGTAHLAGEHIRCMSPAHFSSRWPATPQIIVVERPQPAPHAGTVMSIEVFQALEALGVKPGESFVISRVIGAG